MLSFSSVRELGSIKTILLYISQQAATGVFGLGAVQTRCIKTYTTDPVPLSVRTTGSIPLRMARLQWHSGKTVAIMLSDGSETRYYL